MSKPKSAIELAEELLAKAESDEDPWLISYADLVTNLLAFMVVLVSMAGFSFRTAEAIEGIFEQIEDRKAPPLVELGKEIKQLADAEGLSGKVEAAIDKEGLAIQLQDQILFPSGVATLTPEGRSLVRKLGKLLGALPPKYKVDVEGHTDDVPISTPRFSSNWDLSAARALEVRKDLETDGVADDRLSITAYADTRPAPSPDGATREDRRKRNRRVVIRVYY
jgi:chemotaxis protein MotB